MGIDWNQVNLLVEPCMVCGAPCDFRKIVCGPCELELAHDREEMENEAKQERDALQRPVD